MDYRVENWERAIRNNAIAHIKARTNKSSYVPTEKEISEEIARIIPKVVKA